MSEGNETRDKISNYNVSNEKGISKTWIMGKSSVTLIFEKKIAYEYGLFDSSDVMIQPVKEGILIKKSLVSR